MDINFEQQPDNQHQLNLEQSGLNIQEQQYWQVITNTASDVNISHKIFMPTIQVEYQDTETVHIASPEYLSAELTRITNNLSIVTPPNGIVVTFNNQWQDENLYSLSTRIQANKAYIHTLQIIADASQEAANSLGVDMNNFRVHALTDGVIAITFLGDPSIGSSAHTALRVDRNDTEPKVVVNSATVTFGDINGNLSKTRFFATNEFVPLPLLKYASNDRITILEAFSNYFSLIEASHTSPSLGLGVDESIQSHVRTINAANWGVETSGDKAVFQTVPLLNAIRGQSPRFSRAVEAFAAPFSNALFANNVQPADVMQALYLENTGNHNYPGNQTQAILTTLRNSGEMLDPTTNLQNFNGTEQTLAATHIETFDKLVVINGETKHSTQVTIWDVFISDMDDAQFTYLKNKPTKVFATYTDPAGDAHTISTYYNFDSEDPTALVLGLVWPDGITFDQNGKIKLTLERPNVDGVSWSVDYDLNCPNDFPLFGSSQKAQAAINAARTGSEPTPIVEPLLTSDPKNQN